MEDHTLAELSAWSVNRYLDQVQDGDDLALWQSGRHAGVIALGQVTGQPFEDPGAADAHWADPDQAKRTRWWLPLRLTDLFLDAPVTREELRHDPRFARAAILLQPFAGNPFPLSDPEWAAILDLHQGNEPRSPVSQAPTGRFSPVIASCGPTCINATTGIPAEFYGGNTGQTPDVSIAYTISRVTVADVENGNS